HRRGRVSGGGVHRDAAGAGAPVFHRPAPAAAASRAARIVRVRRDRLTSEPPPAPPYDLIVCRNVVIYFDRAMQDRLFAAFVDALAPGGLLLLGKVETVLGPARERLLVEDARERIFRKPAR